MVASCVIYVLFSDDESPHANETIKKKRNNSTVIKSEMWTSTVLLIKAHSIVLLLVMLLKIGEKKTSTYVSKCLKLPNCN